MTDKMPENRQENRNSEATPNPPGWWGRMLDWYKVRVEACDLFDFLIHSEQRRSGLGDGKSPVDVIGKWMWVTLALVIISGIGLLVGYSPTTGSSLMSVEYIQREMPFGWWLRGVHKWGTDVFIILALVRILRIAYRRAYRGKGEFTWLGSGLVLVLAMAAGLTGYLLVWNQRAFWMEGVPGGISAGSEVYPLGGLGLSGWVKGLIVPGEGLTQAGLNCVFAVHLIAGLIAAAMMARYRTVARKLSPRWREFSTYIPKTAMWTVIGALTFVALIFPPPIGGPLDGLIKPNPLFADWYFIPLYELSEILTKPAAISLMVIVLLVGILLPWIDNGRSKGQRPAVTVLITATVLTGFIYFLKGLGAGYSSVGSLMLSTVVWLIALVTGMIAEGRRSAEMRTGSKGEVTVE